MNACTHIQLPKKKSNRAKEGQENLGVWRYSINGSAWLKGRFAQMEERKERDWVDRKSLHYAKPFFCIVFIWVLGQQFITFCCFWILYTKVVMRIYVWE